MRPLDLEYICQMIGNLAGIPIRIFYEGELTFFYSLTPLPKDPMAAHWKQVMAVSQPLGYYASEHFLLRRSQHRNHQDRAGTHLSNPNE